MAVANDELALAISVTGTFENSGDPYVGITGDFDGMGISCGVQQWNIGSNSLQPLVRLVGQPVALRTMPTKGAEMWTACNAPITQGLQIVRAWQANHVIQPAIAAELRALMGSPEMRAAQLRRIVTIAQNADTLTVGWAHDLGRTQRTVQEFVWFFDILTQNGGMKGIGYADVEAFLASSGANDAVGVICDWLANVPANWWGHGDSVKNAALWRNGVSPNDVDLFVLSYLRASVAGQVLARGLTMNRKGTLAVRKGHVNSTLFDFTGKF